MTQSRKCLKTRSVQSVGKSDVKIILRLPHGLRYFQMTIMNTGCQNENLYPPNPDVVDNRKVTVMASVRMRHSQLGKPCQSEE